MNSWRALSTLLLIAGSVASCEKQGDSARPAAREQVIKLGFAAPLTGPQAHHGEETRNGVILALEEINVERPVIGGKPTRFELVVEDDQADPKQGTIVAQKLVDVGVKGVLGHFNSGTSIPASRIYAEAGIPQIAMATAPAYTAQGFKTTFRAMTNDVQQGSVMGRFVVERLGSKRIALVDDQTAYGQGLAQEFEKAARAAGGEIVRREFVTDKDTDFTAILTNIKAAKPDVIFFAGADAQAGPMARQIKQLGIAVKLSGGEMLKSSKFIQLSGEAAEGAIASIAGLPLAAMPGGKEYEARYRARFNIPVETYSPYFYDATKVLVAAIKKANSADPAQYLPELAKTQYAGVTSARIAYDEKGDLLSAAVTVYRVEEGEWKVLETIGN